MIIQEELGRAISANDWSNSSIGVPKLWPQSLRTTLGILYNSNIPMFLFWGVERFCFLNEAFRESFTIQEERAGVAVKGQDIFPQLWATIHPFIDSVFLGGSSSWCDDLLVPRLKSGGTEDLFWKFHYTPVRNESGSTEGVLVTCVENTQRVLAYERLNASQENIRNMIRQAPVGMCILSGDHLVVEEVNELFLELIGKSRAPFKGKPYWEVYPQAQRNYLQVIKEVLRSGNAYHAKEQEVVRPRPGKDEIVFVDFVYEPMKDSQGTSYAIMIVAIDVTSKVVARRELESAYEQARLSKEAAQLGTFDMDLKKGSLEWDNRCRELFGISHFGKVTYENDFLPGLHPEDRDRVSTIIGKLFIKSLSDGNYDVEYRTVGMEDQKVRWVRAKGKVFFDQDDAPLRFIGSVLDITEQKSDEIRKNDFIGMVSHELKTPLTSLKGFTQLLIDRTKRFEDQFTENTLARIEAQVNKMGNMINGFLNVSRLETGKLRLESFVFNLNDLIIEMIDDIKPIVHNHPIVFTPCEPVEVKADRDKIGQVITNLLTNANKYSSKDKPIKVECMPADDQIRVNVVDTGIGIKEKYLGLLFDRFYRVETHEIQHISGFGIGLYLSAEIIKLHQGQIWAESIFGEGSTFSFTLPIVD